MIRPKNETEDLLLSITKNCDSLLNKLIQIHKKHLNFNSSKPEKLFHVKHHLTLVLTFMGCLDQYD